MTTRSRRSSCRPVEYSRCSRTRTRIGSCLVRWARTFSSGHRRIWFIGSATGSAARRCGSGWRGPSGRWSQRASTPGRIGTPRSWGWRSRFGRGPGEYLCRMNAIVYGHGVVGAATALVLDRAGIAARFWDLLPDRRTCEWGDVLAADVIFLCLSTMVSVDEDSKVVREEVKRLDDAGYAKQYVLRTTVAPGTADRLCKDFALVRRWCSWPEFLREATWQEDALHPDRVILGVPRYGPWPAPTEAESPVPLLKNVAGTVFPQAPVHTLTPTQAELAKLVSNALLALRISVWSELAGKYKTPQVATFGRDDPEPMIDDAFMAAVAADQRLGSFGGVRFGAAFGGKCLPKD